MRLECGDKAIVYTEEQRKAFIGNLEKICNKDQKLKKKFEKTGVVKELRERQKFTKPSVVLRGKKIKAIYKEKMQRGTEE